MNLRAVTVLLVIGAAAARTEGQSTKSPATPDDVQIRPVLRTTDGAATTQPSADEPEPIETPTDLSRALTIQETIALLNEHGLKAVDRTGEMDQTMRASLRQSTLKVKAAHFSVIDIDECGVVLALHFMEAKGWGAFTKGERTYLRFGGTVLLPTRETTAWHTIRDFGYVQNAEVAEPDDVKLWSLLANINTLNAQVTLYEFSRGRAPDMVKEQWKPLLHGGFIHREPFNPLAKRDVATKSFHWRKRALRCAKSIPHWPAGYGTRPTASCIPLAIRGAASRRWTTSPRPKAG